MCSGTPMRPASSACLTAPSARSELPWWCTAIRVPRSSARCQQRVGLRQVDRHRLLHVQVAGAGGQHAHGQREVQVGLHRHDDDVRLDGRRASSRCRRSGRRRPDRRPAGRAAPGPGRRAPPRRCAGGSDMRAMRVRPVCRSPAARRDRSSPWPPILDPAGAPVKRWRETRINPWATRDSWLSPHGHGGGSPSAARPPG